MILQALTEYYYTLEQAGKIAAPGWSPVKVSFALQIGPDGAKKLCGHRKSSPCPRR